MGRKTAQTEPGWWRSRRDRSRRWRRRRRSSARGLAELHVAVDVLEHHDGVVDQQTDGQGASAIRVMVFRVKPKEIEEGRRLPTMRGGDRDGGHQDGRAQSCAGRPGPRREAKQSAPGEVDGHVVRMAALRMKTRVVEGDDHLVARGRARLSMLCQGRLHGVGDGAPSSRRTVAVPGARRHAGDRSGGRGCARRPCPSSTTATSRRWTTRPARSATTTMPPNWARRCESLALGPDGERTRRRGVSKRPPGSSARAPVRRAESHVVHGQSPWPARRRGSIQIRISRGRRARPGVTLPTPRNAFEARLDALVRQLGDLADRLGGRPA